MRASEEIAIDHPRQAWSEENFVPGALGVPGALSFDERARAAALRMPAAHTGRWNECHG